MLIIRHADAAEEYLPPFICRFDAATPMPDITPHYAPPLSAIAYLYLR